MKKLIVATIAAFVVMFLLAGLFQSVLIADFVEANVDASMRRVPVDMTMIASGYLLLSLFMAYLYPKLERDPSIPALSGLKVGCVIGLLWLLPFNLVLHGAYVFPKAALLIDSLWALFEQGAGGMVVAMVYGRKPKL